jgi:hypothetical protein
VILADAGKTRWCELAIAPPGAAQPFAQIFPGAAFVFAHRRCQDLIATALRASRWGLAGQGLTPYLLAHPGNYVSALASYWPVPPRTTSRLKRPIQRLPPHPLRRRERLRQRGAGRDSSLAPGRYPVGREFLHPKSPGAGSGHAIHASRNPYGADPCPATAAYRSLA